MMKNTCDLYDEFGLQLEIMPFGLRSYGGRSAFFGPVETVKCFEDNSRIRELAQNPGEGRVLVVDAGASLRYAVTGDMIAGNFFRNGWAGVVLWGAVRDVAELAKLNFGIMALGNIMRPSIRRGEGQVGVTINIGDARINSGDFLVADEDGVINFPQNVTPPES
jgi:regulator of ribonuclease activity A